MPPDDFAPELGSEDPEFLRLLEQARSNVTRSALPVLIVAADPPRLGDPEPVAQAKAVAVAEAWAQQQGAVFGGVLDPGGPRRQKTRGAA